MIFFYGGSWDSRQQGRLSVRRPGAGRQRLSPWSFRTIASIPQVRFPAFVEDGAQAVRWTADRVGIDKLFVMGHSAGAHIALMLATNTPYLRRPASIA